MFFRLAAHALRWEQCISCKAADSPEQVAEDALRLQDVFWFLEQLFHVGHVECSLYCFTPSLASTVFPFTFQCGVFEARNAYHFLDARGFPCTGKEKMYEEFVTCGHQGKVPDDGSYPQLIPAEQETDHSKYKPVKRCPVAEATAERKKDIFDEPEQNSALLGNRGVETTNKKTSKSNGGARPRLHSSRLQKNDGMGTCLFLNKLSNQLRTFNCPVVLRLKKY